MRFWVILAAVLSLGIAPFHTVAAAQPPLKHCKVGFQRFYKNRAIIIRRMNIRPGETCVYAIPYARGVTIDEIKVIDKPKRGRIVELKRNRIVYKAPSAGTDFFAVGYVGRSGTITGGGALGFNILIQ